MTQPSIASRIGAFALTFLAATLIGCQSAPRSVEVFRPVPPGNVATVDVYFDATASLKGFVLPGKRSMYAYFIQLLETRLHSLYSPVETTYGYHSFGTVAQSFTGVEKSFIPSFYDVRKGYEDTDLSVVANELKPAGLTILITDLFQSDDHIETFRAALLRKGLGKDFQFGIIALPADFDGTIYDIPPAKSSLYYRGPRPVYALVMGPAAQVRALLSDVLKQGPETHIPFRAALFSSDLGQVETPLNDLPRLKTPPLPSQPGSYFYARELDPNTTPDLIQGGPHPFTRQLRLAAAATHPQVELQTLISFQPYEALPADPQSADSWKLETTLRACPPTQSSLFGTIGKPQPSPQKKATSEACPLTAQQLLFPSPRLTWTPEGNAVAAHLTFDLGPNNLKHRSDYVYVVGLRIVPRTPGLTLPGWVASYSENRLSVFSGARTPNLADFLTTMSESIVHSRAPSALDDYLYLDSK